MASSEDVLVTREGFLPADAAICAGLLSSTGSATTMLRTKGTSSMDRRKGFLPPRYNGPKKDLDDKKGVVGVAMQGFGGYVHTQYAQDEPILIKTKAG